MRGLNQISPRTYSYIYDFDVDGGTQITRFSDCITPSSFFVQVLGFTTFTTFASAGAATISLGVTAAPTSIANMEPLATFTAGTSYCVAVGAQVPLQQFTFIINNFDLTAGKFLFFMTGLTFNGTNP